MTDIQKTETEHLEKGDLVSVTHAREDGVMDLRGSERAKAERNLKWKLDIRLNG